MKMVNTISKTLKQRFCLILSLLLIILTVSAAAEEKNEVETWLVLAREAYEQEDYKKAAEYYQLSADQNDPDGLECLGYLYLEGLGVEQSRDRAMELYRLAAALGSEEAQRQLAILED